MQFTLDDIRSGFDSCTFARGQAYARNGVERGGQLYCARSAATRA